MKNIIIAVIIFLNVFPAFALISDSPLADEAMEARAKALFREIRCVVCQSETIADSHAEVAKDVRYTIRNWIKEGIDDNTIKEKLTAQYGNVILMKPPLERSTILLWAGPWLILIAGGFLLYAYLRNNQQKKI